MAAGLQALAVALLANAMSVADFGRFFVIVSITYLVMTPFEFGFGTLALRVLREEDPHRTIATIVTLRAATTLVVLGTVVGGSHYLGDQPLIFLFAASLWAASEAVGNLCQNLLIGLSKEGAAVALLLARRTLIVAALVTATWADDIPFLAIIAAACALQLTLPLCQLLRDSTFPMQHPVALLRSRGRFWLTGIGDNFRQFDTVIVGAFGGVVIAGYFAAASRLVAPLGILTSSLVQSMVPEIVRRNSPAGETREFVRRVLRGMSGFAAILCLSSAAAPWVVRAVFGPDFVPAWPIASAILIAAGFTAMNQTILAWEIDRGLSRSVTLLILTNTLVYLLFVSTAIIVNATPTALAIAVIASAALYHFALRYRFHLAVRPAPREVWHA